MDKQFSTFGQEFYFQESINAIERFHDVREPEILHTNIAGTLPHDSEKTRLRIATKIIQRYFHIHDGYTNSSAYLRMVNSRKNESDKRDLLYWRTAKTDNILTAIASNIFYPYFIQNTFPAGYDEESFNINNTGTLFEIDRIITSDFVAAYSRKTWGFDSSRTIKLALRIMRQAEILDAVSTKLGRKSILGYYAQPHSVKPEIFAFCAFEEFMHNSSVMPSLDQIQSADIVKIFMLNRLQVDSILKHLERKRMITQISQHGGRYIKFAAQDIDSFVRLLI